MTHPTADGGLTSERGMSPVAARPQTDLQRRVEQELAMHHEVAAKAREGGPDGMSEIDRELTMAVGALEGLYQRLGGLAAKLGPVMPGDTLSRLQRGDDFERSKASDFEINSEVGQRIAAVRRAISEIEDALGLLANSVRL